MSETFRVVQTLTPTPSALHASKRHERVEDAIAACGEGIVVGVDGDTLRLVAFHHQHWSVVNRRGGVVSLLGRA